MTISGRELALWRQGAIVEMKALELSPKEVDLFLAAFTDLDPLSLRLGSFLDRDSITLSLPWSEIVARWRLRVDRRYPLQYIFNRVPWRDFDLKVNENVLIPRPETELIIEIVGGALKENPELRGGNWVDLGTGSGAIAIGLARLLTDSRIYAVDLDKEALEVARANIIDTGSDDRIELHRGSWWSPLEFLKGRVRGMVSNPPYIPSADIPTLQPEVRDHEPRIALDGGEDGLTAIRHLIETAPEYLEPGALWLVEIMAGQGERVARLLEGTGEYNRITIIPDLAGFDRFVRAHRR